MTITIGRWGGASCQSGTQETTRKKSPDILQRLRPNVGRSSRIQQHIYQDLHNVECFLPRVDKFVEFNARVEGFSVLARCQRTSGVWPVQFKQPALQTFWLLRLTHEVCATSQTLRQTKSAHHIRPVPATRDTHIYMDVLGLKSSGTWLISW